MVNGKAANPGPNTEGSSQLVPIH